MAYRLRGEMAVGEQRMRRKRESQFGAPGTRPYASRENRKVGAKRTMLLTVVFSSLISPLAPMSTVLVRSPFATAFVTEAISRTCKWEERAEVDKGAKVDYGVDERRLARSPVHRTERRRTWSVRLVAIRLTFSVCYTSRSNHQQNPHFPTTLENSPAPSKHPPRQTPQPVHRAVLSFLLPTIPSSLRKRRYEA